jgi:hypothetical protein
LSPRERFRGRGGQKKRRKRVKGEKKERGKAGG